MSKKTQGTNGIPKAEGLISGRYISVPKGIAISPGSGSDSTGSTTYTPAGTKLSVSLTTTGRPVFVSLIYDTGDTVQSFIKVARTDGSGTLTGIVAIFRDGNPVFRYTIENVAAGNLTSISIPTSSVNTIDFPPAGNWTYDFRYAATGGGSTTIGLDACRLIAYEI